MPQSRRSDQGDRALRKDSVRRERCRRFYSVLSLELDKAANCADRERSTPRSQETQLAAPFLPAVIALIFGRCSFQMIHDDVFERQLARLQSQAELLYRCEDRAAGRIRCFHQASWPSLSAAARGQRNIEI